MEVSEFDWDSSRKGASQLPRTTTIRLSTPKTTTGEILILALTSPLIRPLYVNVYSRLVLGLPVNHGVPSSKPAVVTGSVFSALSIAVMQASTTLYAMNCADTHGELGTHLLGVAVTRVRFMGLKGLYTPACRETYPLSSDSLVRSAFDTEDILAKWWPTDVNVFA